MAQGYRTAQPQFIDDIIYQPPWELIMQAGAMKQKQYDESLEQAELLGGLLKFDYVKDEVETSNVNMEKQYWESKIEDLTDEIKTSGDYRKAMPKIREIQKEITKSMESGNIYKFTQNAAIRDKHLKALEEAKKGKGGEIAATQRAYQKYLKDWEGQENRSLDGVMGYEDIISTPEELKGDNILATAAKVPEWKGATFEINPAGGYFMIKDNVRKEITTDRLLRTVSAYINSNADVPLYLDQRDRLGMGKYFEGEGENRQLIAPFSQVFRGPNGESLDRDAFVALPEKEREKYRQDYDFANNSYGNAHRLGASLESLETETKAKLQIDQVAQNALNRENQWALQKDRQAFTENMEEIRQQNKIELKALIDGEGGELAREKLAEQYEKTSGLYSLGAISNAPVIGLLEAVSNVGPNNVSQSTDQKLESAFKSFTKDMGEEEKAKWNTLYGKLRRGEITTSLEANQFLLLEKYPTEDSYVKEKIGLRSDVEYNGMKRIGSLGKPDGIKTEEELAKEKKEQEWLIADAGISWGLKMDKLNKYRDDYEHLLAGGESSWFWTNRPGISDVGDYNTFSDKMKEYLDANYNSEKITKNFEPVSDASAKELVSIINDNKKSVHFLDAETGEAVILPNKKDSLGEDIKNTTIDMVSSKGVSGATGQDFATTMYVGEDGKEYIARAGYNTPIDSSIRKLAVEGLPKESLTRKELANVSFNLILQEFQSRQAAFPGPESNKPIMIVDESKFYGTGSRVYKLPDGKYEVVEPRYLGKSPKMSEQELNAYMIKLQEREKKLKESENK